MEPQGFAGRTVTITAEAPAERQGLGVRAVSSWVQLYTGSIDSLANAECKINWLWSAFA